jgi:N-acetylmuramoyl-L-alanine amidase
MVNNTWDDIGYNFLVADNGEIFQGRGWNYTGAHCKGFNAQSIGTNIF